jgi:hypothetical protein
MTLKTRRNTMNKTSTRVVLMLVACIWAAMPSQAQSKHCSTAKTAGSWAYTYTGTIFIQGVPVPAAAVGRYHQDTAGNISGKQTRTVAGHAAAEDISGSVTVNPDCTATATLNVLVNGELQRTAVLAGVYDTNMNHARHIFESLKPPDGTELLVVLTADVARLFPKD